MKPVTTPPPPLTLGTWLVSDTHWGYGNIVQYANRPEDHNERMLAAWRDWVGPEDVVLHLGDLAMTKAVERWGPEIRALPGHKYLVPGNHDGWTNRKVLEHFGFRVVTPISRNPAGEPRLLTDVNGWQLALSHRPLTVAESWDLNIHGHIHTKGWGNCPAPGPQVNISVERTNYAPLRLGQVLAGAGEWRQPRRSLFDVD